MYVKYNRTLHGPLTDGRKPPLSVNFIRKFLVIARRRGRSVPHLVAAEPAHALTCRSISVSSLLHRAGIIKWDGSASGIIGWAGLAAERCAFQGQHEVCQKESLSI